LDDGRLEEELLIARLKAESRRCQAENDALRKELKASHAQHAEALRTAAVEWVRAKPGSNRLSPALPLRPRPLLLPPTIHGPSLPSPTTPFLHL
jgi:hypothetical protein